MKVILLQDVPGTGKKNQVLSVSDGFARNYLLPRKWAVEAGESAVKEIERKQEAERKLEAERRAQAEKVGEELRKKTVVLPVKCGEKGRLYGSVTVQEIAAALEKQHGVTLDKRKLELSEPIRTTGEYELQVTVYSGIKVPMKVSIVPAQ